MGSGLLDTQESRVRANQVGLAPIPSASPQHRRYTCLGGWNLMMNDRSSRAKKRAAWTFMRFATAAEQQRRRAREGGFLPTLRSLYDDENLLRAVPVMQLGREAIEDARRRPVSPFYMQMSPRLAQAYNRTLRGEITGAEAVQRLENELQTIVRRNR